MKKFVSAVLIGALSISLLSGCGSSASSNESTTTGGEDVILVNDTALTSNYVDARISQLFQQNQLAEDDAMADYYKGQIIASLVETELLMQEAANRGLEATDEEVAELRQQLIDNRYGSEETFQDYLDEYNIDDEMIERMMREKILYDKVNEQIREEVTVDAETYYNENQDEFYVEDQVQASHILVDDEETAKEIIEKLDNGESFADLAKEYTTDTYTAESGGELGYFTADTMVEEFSDAAFALEVGSYTTEPVATSYGYHVIYVTDKKEAHQQTYEEVQEDLTERLTEEAAQQQFNELIESLKEKATIEYLSDDYNPDMLIEKTLNTEDTTIESSSTAENSDSNTDTSDETDTAEEE